MSENCILVVLTNSDAFRKVGWRTGLWFSELTHFSDEVEKAGYSVTIASPSGGKIPIDPESLMVSEMATAVGLEGAVAKHYRDREFMDRLEQTVKVADVRAADYAAIYLAGGHGALFDFAESADLARVVADFYEADRIVSAVCHGPSGLLDVRLGGGQLLVAGRNVTGFSWVEVRRDDAVPFSLEERLKDAGAHYSKAAVPFTSHVVEDGRLITGQNSGSAQAVGAAVARRLAGRQE